ncbi:hypothetical protein [Variovorax sp. KBS0712]|uniref:hypothetical protein n=1 Tax=Variovorax sp. KBS0712 TaxID=2578111 RepID=UPI0021B11CCD|nr:hypothetical protein [Variovorax sp. KBS0712]
MLVWSVWEVGFDWWPLAARGGVLAAFWVAAVFSWTREPGRIGGIAPLPDATSNAADDWTAYSGTGFGQRCSALDQITPANVAQLEEAWHFRTGDVRGQPAANPKALRLCRRVQWH